MGLEALVMCNCFEEGRACQGPVPFDDIYIDEEGYLGSKKLDAARAKYDWRQFEARYGELDDAFMHWAEHCCEHEFRVYCSEYVGNWDDMQEFENRVKNAGGEKEFPLLSQMVFHGPEGVYPAGLAKPTFRELCVATARAPFVRDGECPVVERLGKLLLASAETGNPISWWW